MATVVKNFRIKSGLVVEGSTGTIGGNSILAETAGDSYILNLVGGATLVKSVDSGVFSVDSAGNLTVNANTFDAYGAAADAESAAISAAASDASTKATNALNDAKSYTDEEISGEVTDRNNAIDQAINTEVTARNSAIGTAIGTEVTDRNNAIATAKGLAEAYADGLASNYDAAGSAAAALVDANDYTDTAVSNLVNGAPALLDTLGELATALENNPDIISDLQDIAAGKQDTLTSGSNIDITGSVISVTGLDTEDVEEHSSRLYFTDARALTATAFAYDAAGAAQTAEDNAKTYADDLVETAAEDIADHIALTAGVHGVTGSVVGTTDTQDLSNKRIIDTLFFTDGVTISNEAEIVVLPGSHDFDIRAKQGNLQLASESGDIVLQADGNSYLGSAVSGNEIATEDHVSNAVNNVVNDLKSGVTAFTVVNVNDLVSQRAAQATLASPATGSSVMAWAKADYKTAKAWVKFETSTHSQVSEVLFTTDAANNVAITEFAEVGTNGSLGTVSATYLNGNIAIEVNTVHAATTVTVLATLIK